MYALVLSYHARAPPATASVIACDCDRDYKRACDAPPPPTH